MSDSDFRGPVVNSGSLMDGRIEPFDGPMITYQGKVIPDPRFSPINKDGITAGRIAGFMDQIDVVLVDNIPSPILSTSLASAQVATSGTAMTLVTVAPGGATAGVPSFCPGVPIVPVGTTSVVTVSALDFGFTTGTTAAGTGSINVFDSTLFYVGQSIVVGGAGNSTLTKALVTQVTSITNATTIIVSPQCLGALSNAPIGSGNFYGALTSPAGASANATQPYVVAGASRILNAPEAITRNVTVTGANATATATFIVSGYDLYGNAMTELITASATTAVGKKAFKYVASVTPQATNANNFTVGVGDTYGLNLRSDKWEYTTIAYSGSFASNNKGWTVASTTTATNTTGDVRGTVQVNIGGTAGGTSVIATTFFNTPSNGTSRLVMMMSIPTYNIMNSNPNSYTSLFGVAQA